MIDECEIMVTSFYIIEWMGAGYVCYLDIIAGIWSRGWRGRYETDNERVGIRYFCKLHRHDNWLAQDLYYKCKGYLYSYSCI